MITASGILFLAPDKKVLLLKRGNGSDHPNEWCIPGGEVEEGETTEQAAVREAQEEAGEIPDGIRTQLMRGIAAAEVAPTATVAPTGGTAVFPSVVPPVPAPSETVEFTTYVQRVDSCFQPTLNDESTGYAWADINNPPEPLHPGTRTALERLMMDELGIARAMAEGRICSPHRYENVTLFNIRITGTGVAYRTSLDEFVWRDPSIYLNEEFLARCNGLPVIMEHPDNATLDSKEFAERVVGTILLPYMKPEAGEVWGIAKIYDDAAIKMMIEQPMSTSPSVVFKDPSVNSKMTLADGSALLIEGKPSLLDHIAICKQGVWDKGGEPTGVINDSIGDLKVAEHEDKKMDADAGEKLDKMLTALDSLHKRMDAMEAGYKADAEACEDDDEERDDALTTEDDDDEERGDADEYDDADEMCDDDDDMEEEIEPRRVAADKKRKDAEEKRRMEESAKADADLRKRIADVEKMLPKQMSDADYAALADAQAKADSVFQVFGDAAPRPLIGEDLNAYRRRMAATLKVHSPKLKDVNLHAIKDSAAFDYMEEQIYSDAMAAAMAPVGLPNGQMREIKQRDTTGRVISSFVGEPRSWLAGHGAVRRRLAGIRNA